jgi:glycosyltransferase involved in cell wall biosynthesis
MVLASPFPANHGTPGSIKEMASALARANHQLHIVTYPSGDGPSPSEMKVHRTYDLGLKKEVVVGPTWQKPILDFLLVFTLCRVVWREKIDVIHAHNYEGGLVGFVARVLTRRPLVYNAINTMSDELPSYNFIKPRILAVWLARALDYFVPRMANRIISISDDLAVFLEDQKIGRERIRVIPLGIDMTPFEVRNGASSRARYRLPDAPLVMYTGVLDAFQRIDYLVKSMQKVVAEFPQARLVLVTNIARDEDVAECKRMARELGLQDRLDIFLNVPFEEVPVFLAMADVTVVSRPSCPGFPVKLLNYMAARKPIVVFAGSAKGLRDQENAVVVPDHDWEGIGRGILSILKDAGLADRLGRKGHQWARENYSWPVLAGKIENVYYEVVGKGTTDVTQPVSSPTAGA